ncbi:MAG: site-specific integrase, partial [Sulfurimonas sp.]|nr:site-specific integrase [Sulfurimonas sp.]
LDIKQYLNSLNIKSASKGAYKNCLSEIFELAVDDGILLNNPASNIRLKKDEPKHIEHYSKEEVYKILDASSGYFKVFLQIAFNTGMRTGEILGLQLGDFEDDFISIKRTRTKGVVGSGKTWNARREIPYPKFLKNLVKEIQTNNIFIFGNIDDAGKLDYVWRETTLLAKVRKLRLYSTRHTFASLMLQDKKVSINELAGLLGHASAKTTLDKYVGVVKANKVDLGNDFSLFCDKSGTVRENIM